jgi:GNAT superfamily N-acetyltransferase
VETARPAAETDLPALARLWQEAVAELDGQRGGWSLAGSLSRSDLTAFLVGALADPDRLLVLGEIDAEPVGLASLWADRTRREPLGQLELIFVEPEARRVGVAEAMLSVVVARCEEWGMAGLDAPALPGNRAAKSFFETQRMQARLLVMHRPLGSGPNG